MDFDGADDYIVVPNLDLSGTNVVTAVLWRYNSDFTPTGSVLELSPNFNGSSTGFGYFPPATFINQTHAGDNTNNFGINDLYFMARGGASLFESEELDDTRIYNRALTATEIAELYRADTSSAVNTANFLTAAP